jgi:hypothetical protein
MFVYRPAAAPYRFCKPALADAERIDGRSTSSLVNARSASIHLENEMDAVSADALDFM